MLIRLQLILNRQLCGFPRLKTCLDKMLFVYQFMMIAVTSKCPLMILYWTMKIGRGREYRTTA